MHEKIATNHDLFIYAEQIFIVSEYLLIIITDIICGR